MKQDYTKVKREILNSLFEGYLKNGGTPIFNISEIIVAHGFSLTEVGNFLIQNKLVKNQVFRPKDFFASISLNGIKEINPDWLDNHFSKIIATLVMNGNKKTSVMDILEFERKDFQIAEDISKAFENIGFAEIEIVKDDI